MLIQELGSKYTNEQQKLRKLCFFNLEALARDAVGQNLIPDNISVLVFFIVRRYMLKKMAGKPKETMGLMCRGLSVRNDCSLI